MTDFPTREVREGRASLLVPDVPFLGGPGRKTALPFYNPAMAVNRDVTISVLAAWLPTGASVLDGLASTGVFGIRAALETGRDPTVTWNDKNPHAHEFILENARRNGVTGEALADDLRTVLSRQRFAYVDIDPFGPPVPFVDAAVQQAGRGGALGFTATDVATLAGTYPRTCWRRYGARSMRTPCGAETAVRIFLGYLVRMAAAHERGVRPLAAFAAEHFVKAIAAVDPRIPAADEALGHLGYVRFEGARFETTPVPPSVAHAGPLWLGPLGDPQLLSGTPANPDPGFAAVRLLDRLRAEADLPPFFYENASLARTVGIADPISVAAFLEGLRTAGFRAARTHFTANGVRTDAPWEDVARLYRAAADR